MIKHIVLFKIRNSEDKLTKCSSIKEALLSLKGTIAELKEIEVGINENEEESFDIALSTIFDNFDDLRAYAIHPAHVAVAKTIRPIVEQRACVDYTL